MSFEDGRGYVIGRDSPRDASVGVLLRDHLEGVAAISPPGSIHALDVGGLSAPGVTFWSARDGEAVLGCAALLELDHEHGEVKSMKTARQHLRRGIASALLSVVIDEARARGYRRLSLETGSQAEFEPARRLYAAFGFSPCGPFGSYREDPNSSFMTLDLSGPPAPRDA